MMYMSDICDTAEETRVDAAVEACLAKNHWSIKLSGITSRVRDDKLLAISLAECLGLR